MERYTFSVADSLPSVLKVDMSRTHCSTNDNYPDGTRSFTDGWQLRPRLIMEAIEAVISRAILAHEIGAVPGDTTYRVYDVVNRKLNLHHQYIIGFAVKDAQGESVIKHIQELTEALGSRRTAIMYALQHGMPKLEIYRGVFRVPILTMTESYDAAFAAVIESYDDGGYMPYEFQAESKILHSDRIRMLLYRMGYSAGDVDVDAMLYRMGCSAGDADVDAMLYDTMQYT